MIPAGSRRANVTASSMSVELGLTWMVVLPAAIARSVSEAAGWTRDEVPIQKNTSQRLADSQAESHSRSGSLSPNQTTPGRTRAAQDLQRGGSMRVVPEGGCGSELPSVYGSRHFSQYGRRISPCKCSTSRLPARS